MDSDGGASYWKDAKSWAWQNTNAFSPWRAIPSSGVAVAQYWRFGVHSVRQTIITIAITFGAYAVFFCVDFVWKLLFKAPATIVTKGNSRISDLTKALEAKYPIDELRETKVSNLLASRPHLRKAFEWLVEQGTSTQQESGLGGIHPHSLPEALAASGGIVRQDANGAYCIAPSYEIAVRNVLYPQCPRSPPRR